MIKNILATAGFYILLVFVSKCNPGSNTGKLIFLVFAKYFILAAFCIFLFLSVIDLLRILRR